MREEDRWTPWISYNFVWIVIKNSSFFTHVCCVFLTILCWLCWIWARRSVFIEPIFLCVDPVAGSLQFVFPFVFSEPSLGRPPRCLNTARSELVRLEDFFFCPWTRSRSGSSPAAGFLRPWMLLLTLSPPVGHGSLQVLRCVRFQPLRLLPRAMGGC
jgi:hypothetical protein